jgi:adenosylcobinamide-phosphate synthase
MFTASHNPAQYNGMKLCKSGAIPIGQESGLLQIRKFIEDGAPISNRPVGKSRNQDLLSAYVDYLLGCFAEKSLRKAAQSVLTPLNQGDIEEARTKLGQFVGRDTDQLSVEDILRATLESVAENTIDGVTSPLFYAILGAFFLPIGSVPLAIAYKAASTLDSMIGYLREPYTDIGWFSAKFEDYLTYLPCRLTVFTLACLSGKPQQVLAICRRDAPQDVSLNSGWSECVYAAILGVQLGGMNSYQGVPKFKPLLGNPDHPITSATVEKAFALTRQCFLLWLAIAIGGLFLKNLLF